MQEIVFIGGGNMASSIIGGLINSGTEAPSITVSDPFEATLLKVGSEFGVHTHKNNADAIKQSTSIVVLAVKPNIVESVCREIGPLMSQDTLVLSIAAGVTETDISRWLGRIYPVVRCMPNTPALLSCGASALFANAACTQLQRTLAEQLLQAAGITIWVDQESQLDAVTALSGSGPAYFFLLIECMIKAAINQGLAPDVAKTLAIETAFGAASMARLGKDSPSTLRENVTSKGGTTAAALNSFEQDNFSETVSRAMLAAEKRAQELGEEFGKP